MSFQKGNNFWEMCANPGAPRKYDTPKKLRNACCKYFKWAQDNPLEIEKHGFFKGCAIPYTERKPRALLISQLCRFLGVSHETWIKWRKTRHDLSEVITWAESVIWEQKFQGAAADVFNGNIISQELGLKQKIEHSEAGETLEEFLQGLEEDNEPEEWATM